MWTLPTAIRNSEIAWLTTLDEPVFAEPFYDQTLQRLRVADERFITYADTSIVGQPDAIIFHSSRCGSTLVSQALKCSSDSIVISEPLFLVHALLMYSPADVKGVQSSIAALSDAIAGLKAAWPGKKLILKVPSWAIMHLRIFRRLYPKAQLIFVMRHPAEVVASLVNDPPSWLHALGVNSATARQLFLESPNTSLSLIGAASWALERMLQQVCDNVDAFTLIDYRMITPSLCANLAWWIGLTGGNESGISEQFVHHVKSGYPYVADSVAKRRYTARAMPASSLTRVLTVYECLWSMCISRNGGLQFTNSLEGEPKK